MTNYETILNNFENVYENNYQTFHKNDIWRILALILLTIIECTIIFFAYKFFSGLTEFRSAHFKILCFIIVSVFGIWTFIQKWVEYSIKDCVMDSFLGNFGNLSWTTDDLVDSDFIKNTKIFPNFGKSNFGTIDNIGGVYNDTNLILSKLAITGGSLWCPQKIFHGLAVVLELKKNIDCEIIIVERDFIIFPNLEEVKLEDPEWISSFKVYSDNQIESRYFLTTSLMEKIKTIKKSYDAKRIGLSIKDNILTIAIDADERIFETCSLIRPISDKHAWKRMYFQILSVLQLSDLFNKTVL